MSFGEVDVLSARFAAYLQTQTSLQPGDRIAIQLPNILQYPVALYGAMRAGLIVVNANPLYTPREIHHQLKDSGARALVILANVADSAAQIIHDTEVDTVIVTELADLHPPLQKFLINSYVKHIKRMVPPYSFANPLSFGDVLQISEDRFVPFSAQSQDIAVLQYTGGTTGVAKGAMLTHANLVANKDQVIERLSELLQPGRENTHVAPLPLYHIYAFTIHCAATFSIGNHSLLIPNPRDIPAFVKALKSETVHGFVGINTLFNALCRDGGFRSLDFSHLISTSSGGMALTQDTARLWREVTGNTPNEGYGLTETSPVVSSSPPFAIQSGTVGIPVMNTEVKVVNDDGESLPNGQVGELHVKGPQVMKGYWQRPEATQQILGADGWLSTGDMAMIQEDGYIRIVDRKKDMVLVSGFNVYPNEVEDVVTEHPGVLEAGVVGVEDAKSGEVVKLFVVRSDKSLTADEIRQYCRENMAGYKVPKYIEFMDSLPKSAVGKILRRELKAADTHGK